MVKGRQWYNQTSRFTRQIPGKKRPAVQNRTVGLFLFRIGTANLSSELTTDYTDLTDFRGCFGRKSVFILIPITDNRLPITCASGCGRIARDLIPNPKRR